MVSRRPSAPSRSGCAERAWPFRFLGRYAGFGRRHARLGKLRAFGSLALLHCQTATGHASGSGTRARAKPKPSCRLPRSTLWEIRRCRCGASRVFARWVPWPAQHASEYREAAGCRGSCWCPRCCWPIEATTILVGISASKPKPSRCLGRNWNWPFSAVDREATFGSGCA